MSQSLTALRIIQAYGDAVAAAARRPYRAAAYDAQPRAGRPGSRVPLDLAALDAARAARAAATAAILAACRYRDRRLPSGLGGASIAELATIAGRLIDDELRILDDPALAPRSLGMYATVGDALIAAADALPRFVDPAPSPADETPAPSTTLRPGARSRLVTDVEGSVILKSLGMTTTASTIRRWASAGELERHRDRAGRRAYRVGELVDRASAAADARARAADVDAEIVSSFNGPARAVRPARFTSTTKLTREQARVALGEAAFAKAFGDDDDERVDE